MNTRPIVIIFGPPWSVVRLLQKVFVRMQQATFDIFEVFHATDTPENVLGTLRPHTAPVYGAVQGLCEHSSHSESRRVLRFNGPLTPALVRWASENTLDSYRPSPEFQIIIENRLTKSQSGRA
jgi:hypothetical protein